MLTQETKFIRNGASIKDVDSGETTTYMIPGTKDQPSINAAKRESRKLQGTSLGRGIVQLK